MRDSECLYPSLLSSKSEHSGDNLTVVETEDIIHGKYVFTRVSTRS